VHVGGAFHLHNRSTKTTTTDTTNDGVNDPVSTANVRVTDLINTASVTSPAVGAPLSCQIN